MSLSMSTGDSQSFACAVSEGLADPEGMHIPDLDDHRHWGGGYIRRVVASIVSRTNQRDDADNRDIGSVMLVFDPHKVGLCSHPLSLDLSVVLSKYVWTYVYTFPEFALQLVHILISFWGL